MKAREPSARAAAGILGGIVVVSAAVAAIDVFYIPILEAPDETVHFEFSAALYSAGGLIAARDAANISVPSGRTVPYPKYLEDQSAVAVIAEKPDVKAPAGYGSADYYGSVDRGLHPTESSSQLLDPPLLRYYPFGYYLLDAGFMGAASLFTSSSVALFFAARLLSVALLIPSLLLAYMVLRRLSFSRMMSLLLTATIGLFPMTTMMASSIQSDNLAFTLAMLALLAALELRRAPHHLPWMALLGFALGGLLVTKVHYFAIVAVAVLAMIFTQRVDMRDARYWPRELALLVTPSIVLEAVQVWTQWGAPSLISTGQLGDLPDYRTALAGGPVGIVSYLGHIVGFTFLDHTFGREFGSFWGVFGWVDTPLVFGSPAITAAIWVFIGGMSMALLACTLVRLAQVGWRLLRLARRGRTTLALRLAFSNPVAMSYFLLALFLFSVEGYPGIQGRYYFPVLPAVFWVALRYAPRALPARFGRALFNLQVVGLVAYTAVGALFVLPTLTARYYGHGRDLVPVAEYKLQQIDTPGRYEITRVRLPEATLGVGTLPTGRVGVVGWAIDVLTEKPAETVFIDVDGQPFQEAVYGDDSPAAVSALGSDHFTQCGFDAILDTTRLGPGLHQLTVRVVSADGTRLFAPGPAVQFDVGASVGPGSS